MSPGAAGFVMAADQVARMADLRRGVRKGRKIRRVLEQRLGPAPWPRARGLDLGCGPGTITAYLARYAAAFTGVDIDGAAIAGARERWRGPGLAFVQHDGPRLPFDDGAFDVVVVNHVYEHVREPAALFAEVRRLLAPDGVAYLAAAGKYQLLEPHYGLPFLSWLPRRWADAYLRAAGRAEGYDVRLLSYRRLRRLLAGFDVREYTYNIIREPRTYAAGDVVAAWPPLRAALAGVARLFPALAPTRVMLLSPKRREPT